MGRTGYRIQDISLLELTPSLLGGWNPLALLENLRTPRLGMPDRLGQNPRIQTVPLLKGLVQCLPTNMFGSTLLLPSRALIELVLISRRI